jgi:hypothetical protein
MGSAGGGSFLPLEKELLLCFWASFFPWEIDDLLVALEVPEKKQTKKLGYLI